MYAKDSGLHLFWQKNPALFYGLVLFLGYIFVLQTPWVLIPFFLLLHQKRFFVAILIFLLPCCLIHQMYTFPSVGSKIEGTFYIHTIKKMERFALGWSYSGIVKTADGRVHCRTFSKHYLSPYQAYTVQAKVIGKKGHTFTIKMDRPLSIKKRLTLAEIRFHAHEYVKNYIERHIVQKRASHFLIGMISGQMEDRLMLNELGQLGLSHLMAISGLHFSLIALFIHLFLRLFLPAKPEAVILILFLTLYFLFIGHSPSILRAWSVAVIFLMGQLIEKRGSALNSLGAAICISLIFNPLSSVQLGFHLSFMATAGILFFYTPCHQWVDLWLPKMALRHVIKKPALWQYGYITLSLLREAIALNLAVHLTLIPLLLALFHTFPISSLFYNLFFPFLASLSLLFFLASIPLGHWAHVVNGYYCDWILKIIEKPPLLFKSFDTATVPPWLLTTVLTFILAAAIAVKIKERTDFLEIRKI